MLNDTMCCQKCVNNNKICAPGFDVQQPFKKHLICGCINQLMARIVISDDMEGEVVELIRKLGDVSYKPAKLDDALKDADALVVRSATKVTAELMGKAPKLRLVARAGTGLDNVDQDACRARNVEVVNTPGASSNAVAELAVGLIICSMRNVQKAHHQMKGSIWDKKRLVGTEIEGKTLGIIGYGRIGRLVGKKANALGMRVIAYSPPPHREDGIAEFVGMDALLGRADVITLHAAVTEENRGMINRGTIAKMKQGAYLINLARGELVDEDALYEACKSGKLGGVALDVYQKEPYTGKLLELDNVFFTPHIGGSTKEAQLKIGQELVDKLKEKLSG